MVTVFFSYSHRDEELRDELETHLSILKHQRVIDTWHDRRIGAGDEFDGKISEHLERADIILLLVSSYFLDSDYCYNLEMTRAMQRHEEGSARVIPVILRPCHWQMAPFGKLLAVPDDGKPVSKYPDQHDAFLEVTKAIEKAAAELQKLPGKHGSLQPEASTQVQDIPHAVITQDIRSSNLRVKKKFSDREKDVFLEKGFEYIAKFFENSLRELSVRDPNIETAYRRVDSNHFSAVIYDDGTAVSQCKIWLGRRHAFEGGIAYSNSIDSNDSSLNESLAVDDDGYSLFLTPVFGSFYHASNEPTLMTYQGGAEHFWSIFVAPVQS